MGFFEDLKFGQKMENIALKNYVEWDTYELAPRDRVFKEYDFICSKDGIDTKYEVKADRRCLQTGNFLIEDKLVDSKADYYVLMACDTTGVEKEVYIVLKSYLEHLIKKYGTRQMGRNNVSLIPMKEFN